MSASILAEYAEMDRTAAADKHEAGGGDRAAFVDGWGSWERGKGMFAGMRFYPEGRSRTSFVIGWQVADRAQQ